jgi:chromosome segregation ATPase
MFDERVNMSAGSSGHSATAPAPRGSASGYPTSTPSSTSSSSPSTHQYAALIQTVTELRNDLERTIGKIKYLEKENYRIQSSYVRVKDELVDTRKKYNETRENYHQAVSEKFEAEKMNEEFMERVKVQLTDKTREFEALKEKFAPQDIDFIRIKLQEELEIPHKHRVQSMENEVELMRQQYFSIKRELERCRAEFDTFANNQKIEATTLISEKEEIIAALRIDLEKYKSRENSLEKDDIIRSQRLKMQDFQQVIDSVKDEVRNVSKERDSIYLLLAETKSKTEELVARYRSQLAVAQAERLAIDQRMSTLNQEIDRKESSNHILREKYDELVGLHDTTVIRLSDAEGKLVELKTELAEYHLSTKVQHSKDMQDLQAEVGRINSRLADREELLRRAQREVSDMQTRTEAMNNEQRRVHVQQVQELTGKMQALQKELDEVTKAASAREHRHLQTQEAMSVELEALRSELLPLKKEKDFLHVRILDLENNLETERRQNLQLKRDSQAKIFTLQQALNSADQKARDLEIEIKKSNLAEEAKLKEVIALRTQIEKLQGEFARLGGQNQREFQEKLAQMESTYLQKVDELKQSFSLQLLKEKKRSQAYKDKAIGAHRREKLISETALQAAMYGSVEGIQGIYPSVYDIAGENWLTAATMAAGLGTNNA